MFTSTKRHQFIVSKHSRVFKMTDFVKRIEEVCVKQQLIKTIKCFQPACDHFVQFRSHDPTSHPYGYFVIKVGESDVILDF